MVPLYYFSLSEKRLKATPHSPRLPIYPYRWRFPTESACTRTLLAPFSRASKRSPALGPPLPPHSARPSFIRFVRVRLSLRPLTFFSAVFDELRDCGSAIAFRQRGTLLIFPHVCLPSIQTGSLAAEIYRSDVPASQLSCATQCRLTTQGEGTFCTP